MAARLVECGFTGETDSISTIYGKVLSDTFDPSSAVAGLGSEWLITKSYFKLHPVGRYAHSAIDALEDLLAKLPSGRVDARQIERIEVRAYMLAALLAETNIISSFGARFSVPFALASIIVHGRSGLKSFDASAVENPEVQALTRRVQMSEEPSFTARYPAEQPVEILMVMRDGSVHRGRCVVTKGEPANPHSEQELTDKFFDLGEPVWGRALTESLYRGLMDLESVGDFRAFADRYVL
jgi:2-methylcitrate dehydratase PrpD